MKEKQDNKADVKGISVDTMETILNFIYTSEITITNYNVYDVLAAADYMQIPCKTGNTEMCSVIEKLLSKNTINCRNSTFTVLLLLLILLECF